MGATQSTEQPHVLDTKLGKLRGTTLLDTSGTAVYHRFLKVPYALPPTGSLRWRRPRALPSDFTFNDSSGSPGDHTKFGPICPQPYYATDAARQPNSSGAAPIENIQSEDCLYINIWVPTGTPPSAGWPVQFHIHGGWLQVGDANQSHDEDPFDLLAHTTPRIIVAPTYRLNLFGFLAGSDLASLKAEPSPSNFGLWDQRAALEWTARHIPLFHGDPSNITVGGLSAGANSTVFQLYYDTHLPASQRLIKRVYLWSNSVAIQPNSATSDALTTQFNDLCSAHKISPSASATDKLSALRQIPATDLITSISRLKMHTFRSSTDSDFISPTFLSSLHSGAFTTKLASHDVSVLLGEVCDEVELYKLVNPPSTYSGLITQLSNYYPKPVVDALLPLYDVPDKDTGSAEAFGDVFSRIVADNQVHASIRGFTHLLLNPPKNEGVKPLPPANVHRYRIEWRAKGLDDWLKPEVGVCHAADGPIWWANGWRAGFTEEDKAKATRFLQPFGEFLQGKEVMWGRTSGDGGREENRIRVMTKDGVTEEDVVDERWERGMKVFGAVWRAQEKTVTKS